MSEGPIFPGSGNNAGMTQATADGLYRKLPLTQNAAPANGATVNVSATDRDVNLWLSPAGTILSATVALPADNVTQIGQIISIGSSQAITTLNMSGATSILNALNTLNPGDLFKLQKVAANTWARIE